jgi:hypothetical protein
MGVMDLNDRREYGPIMSEMWKYYGLDEKEFYMPEMRQITYRTGIFPEIQQRKTNTNNIKIWRTKTDWVI